MSSKLYVGNLSFNTKENDLEEMFASFGVLKSVRIVMDRDTGRSKGFGFVEMSNSTEAQNCVANLDGKDLDGRNVRVNIAEDRAAKPRTSFSNKW